MSKQQKVICEGHDLDQIDIEDVLIWLEDHFDEPYCEDVYELLDELDNDENYKVVAHLTPEEAYEALLEDYDGFYIPLNIRIK